MLTRAAVRAVVVDHAYRLLLLHVTDGTASWWEPPGGEPLPGEDTVTAVARVLREEAGVTAARVGPCVWVRRSGGLLRRVERFHVAWLDDPNAPRAQVAERAQVLGERWWTLDELAASDETFAPAALPALAPAVVRGEYGATPADV